MACNLPAASLPIIQHYWVLDLATFPDFPAEIRAPIGTLPGVSGYQLRFSSDRIFTPGDAYDVLVAMNAKVNLKSLKGAKIIANIDLRAAAASLSAWAAQLAVRLLLPERIFPPEILVPGHSPSQLVKCLTLASATDRGRLRRPWPARS